VRELGKGVHLSTWEPVPAMRQNRLLLRPVSESNSASAVQIQGHHGLSSKPCGFRKKITFTFSEFLSAVRRVGIPRKNHFELFSSNVQEQKIEN
jgi:hypothetical protein